MIKINELGALSHEIENGKSMIKVSTPGCGPCRMVKGYMESLEKEYGDVKFIDIDADECDEEIISRFSISGVPCVMSFKDGKPIDRTVGLQTKEQLRQRIANLNQI